jgi:hypothetical protein
MNQHHESFLRRAHKDPRGQVIPIVLVMVVMFCAFIAIVIDVGRVYVCYRELQISSDAAALAGGALLPDGTAAIAAATLYSGVAGNKNARANLPNVTMVSGYPKVKCLTTLTSQGIACVAPANANSIQVKQQVSVPMTFARLFGLSSVSLTATATAAMRGAARVPYNVAIVVDSTASMNSMDSGSNCSNTRVHCALDGVRVLLGALSPCGASQATCVSLGGGQVQNPVDQVSLFTFPAVTSATVSNEYDCSGSPTIRPYPLPAPGSTPAADPTYQIVDFSSDYRTSDTAASLNTNSHLTAAAGGRAGCNGLRAIGGQNTYYPGVIYAAQSLLLAEQAANPGSESALIILGDGDANATSANLPGASTASTGPTAGLYPSTRKQCHQAVTAAQAATASGIKVYTVAYGATSSGCSTDPNPHITPCQTMQQMASSAASFYTDYTSSSNGCISAAQPTTNLNQIFTAIAGDMTVARLIPDNTP